MVETSNSDACRVALDDVAVVDDPIAVDDAENAVAARLERLQPERVGLGDLARGIDLVVEDDEHALAAGLRLGGDPKSLEQIGGALVSERARIAHRADDDNRLVAADGEIQEVGRLFERVGSARDDDAGELGILREERIDAAGERQPLFEASARCSTYWRTVPIRRGRSARRRASRRRARPRSAGRRCGWKWCHRWRSAGPWAAWTAWRSPSAGSTLRQRCDAARSRARCASNVQVRTRARVMVSHAASVRTARERNYSAKSGAGPCRTHSAIERSHALLDAVGERQPSAEPTGRLVWSLAIERHQRSRPAGHAGDLCPPLVDADAGHLDEVVAPVDVLFEPMHVHVVCAAECSRPE